VYGLRILEAKPAEGMLSTLKLLQEKGIELFLVSHKTKTPYLGPSYNLHDAANGWLEKNGFFEERGLNWSRNKVFLEETKDAKLKRIASLNCDAYIDDLPEILLSLPNSIQKFLYAPFGMINSRNKKIIVVKRWGELIEHLA